MVRRAFIAKSAAGGMLAAAGLASASERSTAGASAAVQSGYAPVNGLQLYYEIYGDGAPLILMHGGIGSIEMFSAILPALSSGRTVIGVDLQGHGRTADIDRPPRNKHVDFERTRSSYK